jgi:hypothetical protein
MLLTTIPPRAVHDLTGESLVNAPEWLPSVDGRYTFRLPADLELELFARVFYMDEHILQVDHDPTQFQGSYTRVDANVALASDDGRWRIALVGCNLTDELTANFGNHGAGGWDFFIVEAPRSYAVQAQVNFGSER